MFDFRFSLASPVPPEPTLHRVLDEEAQTRLIPLTRVRREGNRLLTHTGPSELVNPFGRLAQSLLPHDIGLEDPMVVAPTEHLPDGTLRVRIDKVGLTVLGWVDITVTPSHRETGAPGCLLTWHQHMGVRGLPGCAEPVVAPLVGRGYRSVVRRLLANPS